MEVASQRDSGPSAGLHIGPFWLGRLLGRVAVKVLSLSFDSIAQYITQASFTS